MLHLARTAPAPQPGPLILVQQPNHDIFARTAHIQLVCHHRKSTLHTRISWGYPQNAPTLAECC